VPPPRPPPPAAPARSSSLPLLLLLPPPLPLEGLLLPWLRYRGRPWVDCSSDTGSCQQRSRAKKMSSQQGMEGKAMLTECHMV
jgi:hypothetical protein